MLVRVGVPKKGVHATRLKKTTCMSLHACCTSQDCYVLLPVRKAGALLPRHSHPEDSELLVDACCLLLPPWQRHPKDLFCMVPCHVPGIVSLSCCRGMETIYSRTDNASVLGSSSEVFIDRLSVCWHSLVFGRQCKDKQVAALMDLDGVAPSMGRYAFMSNANANWVRMLGRSY